MLGNLYYSSSPKLAKEARKGTFGDPEPEKSDPYLRLTWAPFSIRLTRWEHSWTVTHRWPFGVPVILYPLATATMAKVVNNNSNNDDLAILNAKKRDLFLSSRGLTSGMIWRNLFIPSFRFVTCVSRISHGWMVGGAFSTPVGVSYFSPDGWPEPTLSRFHCRRRQTDHLSSHHQISRL